MASATTVRQFDQNFLNAPTPRISVESLWETELTSDKLATYLNSAQRKPRPVGLAGGNTPAGRLTILAVAVGSRVLLIRFRNREKASQAARKLLKDELLCSPKNILHAFDMGPLALSLYSDMHLLVTNAVDIQSACSCKENRVVANAVQFAVASTKYSGIHRTNIDTAFGSDAWDEDKPSSLALKAWLAAYLPLVGDMEQRFGEAPKINTGTMPEDVRRFTY